MIPSLSNCSAILSLLLFHLTQPQRTQTTHFKADFNVPKQNLQLTILLSSLFNIKKRRVYADVREFAANQLFFTLVSDLKQMKILLGEIKESPFPRWSAQILEEK